MRIEGSKIVVTGASSGIGAALAPILAFVNAS
jgi:short-subunit dehydrogenase